MRRSRARAAVLAALTALAACGGSGQPATASVEVVPPTVRLAPSATQAFQAVVAGLAATGVTWSVAEGTGGGLVNQVGLYTAPGAAGTYHVVATSVADPGTSGSSTVTVTAAGGTSSPWVGVTAGMVNPHFDNGYAGAFDQSPAGRSDSFVVTGWDAGHPTELRAAYGLLGQAASLTVASFPNSGGNGLDYGASCQDSVGHDLHVVYGTFGGYVQYWRLRPQRTGPGGAIAGLTQVAQFSIPGAKYVDYPAIQEVVDGNGVKRLVLYGVKAVASTQADMALLVTTAAAGVVPATAADFVGPGGEAAAVSVGSLPTFAYNCAIGLAQHRTSRKLEVFMASGQHGASGPQRRVTLAPSGAGWTVGTPVDLPAGIGDALAVQGLGDEVWVVWADTGTVHLSTIDSAGAFTQNAVPSPLPAFNDYRGPRHLALAPDGRMQVIWYLDSVSPPRVSSNVFDGASWSGWVIANPNPGTIFNYLPLMGLAQQGGRTWSGTALSVGSAETAITAASF